MFVQKAYASDVRLLVPEANRLRRIQRGFSPSVSRIIWLPRLPVSEFPYERPGFIVRAEGTEDSPKSSAEKLQLVDEQKDTLKSRYTNLAFAAAVLSMGLLFLPPKLLVLKVGEVAGK